MNYPRVDLNHKALVDRYYKIHKIESDFDLFNVYCWLEDRFLQEVYDIGLWGAKFPCFIFPRTHSCPEFMRKCQSCYDINQRAIVNPAGEKLFSINAQSIQYMMQAPIVENTIPFSYEALRELYQNLDFASRAKTLELFLATNAPMPAKNPPYPSSIFPNRTKHIIIVLSYLLGYHNDQWVDESMIGFLSILSSDVQPKIMFNSAYPCICNS